VAFHNLMWFGASRIPGTFSDGLSNTVLFTEKYARCEAAPLQSSGKPVGGGTKWAHAATTTTVKEEHQTWWPAVMVPDYAKYSTKAYGPTATFLVQPNPFMGTGVICDFTLASTGHSGTIQVGMGDGSVRGVSPSVSPTTWWFAFTPAGGEVLPSDW
jgi:hypothetical protein